MTSWSAFRNGAEEDGRPVLSTRRLVGGFAVIAVVTLFSGVLHGKMSRRWGASEEMRTAAERLAQIPAEVGAWKLETADKLSDTVQRTLECAGYVAGTYVHQETGEKVRLALLLGPSGPISVHTPEVCYSSRDYKIQDPPRKTNVPNLAQPSAQLWTIGFRANNLDADTLRVYYGWSTGTDWTAPKEARLTFAGAPYLYKIQLACTMAGPASADAPDSCMKFLQDFLPVAAGHLVSSPR